MIISIARYSRLIRLPLLAAITILIALSYSWYEPTVKKEQQIYFSTELASTNDQNITPSDLFYEESYNELRNLLFKIMKLYPPENYYYLGLGQSPTPLIAFIQNLGFKASSIPLSSLRKIKEEHFNPEALSHHLSLHFKKFLPDTSELNGKKILVIDYAKEGSSIIYAKHLIDIELQKRSARTQAEYFGLVRSGEYYDAYDSQGNYKGTKSVASRLKQNGIGVLSLDRSLDITSHFFHQEFDLHSEYGSFSVLPFAKKKTTQGAPEESSAIRQPRLGFLQLKAELSQFMHKDQRIQKYIQSLNLKSPLSCRQIF